MVAMSNILELSESREHEGDKEKSFSQMVEKTLQRSYWMALDIVKNPVDAEDARQEAFLKAYENWDDFRGDSKRETWFYKILFHLCLSKQRRKNLWIRFLDSTKEIPVFMGFSPSDPEKALQHHLELEELVQQVELLSEKQKRVFQLRYFHDLSLSEIAEIMDSSLSTIKTHLLRACNQIKQVSSLELEEEVREVKS